jgi:hypothetical protein
VGGKAKGWIGSTLIALHRQRLAAAEAKRRELPPHKTERSKRRK